MAPDLEKRANQAFVDDNFELAIDLYTQAIEIDPKCADLFANRAQANIKLKNYTEADADANKAIELDPLMVKAYLRKGTACIKLEEYETAKATLETGFSLAKDDSRFAYLIKECDEHIAGETRAPSVTFSPPVGPQSPDIAEKAISGPVRNISQQSTKYRHEYYQKPEEVVVTIFAKHLQDNNVVVQFGEQILSVSVDVPGEEAYHFQSRLFAKIIPEKCRYDILSTKIEIRLAKSEAINWTSLEFTKENTVAQKINMSSANESRKPTYPSSKPGATNWDKYEAQLKKEEKEEKLEGDAALNKLFQDIYKDGDEDLRRAMSKSFVESNGTVLSTNWKEVGSKKVEGSPPDGMEMKKW